MEETGIQTNVSKVEETGIQASPGRREPPSFDRFQRDLGPWSYLAHQLLRPLASLRLTVVLLVLSILLVFFGTLAQIDHSLQSVLDGYFRWWVAWVPLQLFVRFGQVFFGVDPHFNISENIAFPYPGGWLLGTWLLINVLAAHAVRFKISWKRSGILLIHAGLIVMLLGELITGIFAVETRMTIWQNGSSNYVESHDKTELAVIGKTHPQVDDVVAIPRSMLRDGELVSHEDLPFDIETVAYYKNSSEPRSAAGKLNLATAGDGKTLLVQPLDPVSGTDTEKADIPSAYVALKEKGTGKALGTFLVSLWFSHPLLEDRPQELTYNGTTYQLYLRSKRTYKPYTLHLKEFRHDVYEGTTIPKNYSSLVRFVHPEDGEDREVKIYMNEPFVYGPDKFFQSGFLPGDKGTILQVVQNPGRDMPYVSCILVAAGMLVHFGIVLITFLTAKLQTLPTAAAAAGKVSFAQVLPWIVVGVIGLGLVARLSMSMAAASPVEGEMNLAEFGRLPVLEGGRVKPMDSLARDSLKIITGGRESFKDTAKNTQPAVVWLLDLLSGKLEEKTRGMRDEDRIPIAQLYPIFRIDNDQVVSLLGLDKKRDGHRYAINEFAGRMETLEIEARKANDADPKKRTAYQAKVIELAEHLQLYISIVRQEKVKIVPPRTAGFEWQSLRQAAREMIDNEVDNPPARYIAGMLSAYKDNKPTEFNRALDDYRKWLDGQATVDTAGASVEYSFYNTFQPFSWCMFLYVGVFALAASSWLVWTWRVPLARTAFWLAVLTLVLHSTALIGRMYLMDRWFVFVTNLYSSAIFIGMVGLGIALVLEVIFPLGVATAVAAVLGFVTTFIADYLSRSGDTLNMLQAVLDTNFWLATHVTCITFGYATTFLAGFLGIAYLGVAALIGPTAGINRGKTGSESGIDWLRILSLMIYGVVCFATLLSFVGTVLGGIWADQSWGRFWGWDPKENGALMIVLWNALILHARWSGMAKQMGVAILAVAGNMIVAWSWFGTNQLGVGLHAYGFNNTIATALVSAWAIHLAVIGAALFLVWKNRLSAPAV